MKTWPPVFSGEAAGINTPYPLTTQPNAARGEDCDVSYATLIFAAMAAGILVWLISTRVYRGEISGLRVTIRNQEATIQGQRVIIRGQEATIETLDEPITLSKDMLWSVEFARVALD